MSLRPTDLKSLDFYEGHIQEEMCLKHPENRLALENKMRRAITAITEN